MTCEELEEIVSCGETSKVQFKQQFSSSKQIAEELVAFANSRGGILLFGIKDKNGVITGLSYSEIQHISHEISTIANDSIRPVIYIQTEVIKYKKAHVLIVYVNEGSNKPYKDLNGHIWIKQGPDKRRITENSDILALFQSSENYFPEKQSITGTTIENIDTKALDSFLEKLYDKRLRDFRIPQERLLYNLHIINTKGELTLAGLLFFSDDPQAFMPQFVIKAVSFYGNSIGGNKYRDSKDISGTIPEMFEQGMAFLKSNLHSVQAGQSFNSIGKLEIPETALEELLQNALVHRDYLRSAPIRLMIFDDRVEIVNPGCLGGNLSIDDIKEGSTFQRNPLIAHFCNRTMIYRGLGSGIIRSLSEGIHVDFVNNLSSNQFSVIIYRPTVNYSQERSTSLPVNLPVNLSVNFKPTTLDLQIINLLHSNSKYTYKELSEYTQKSRETIRIHLKHLQENGVIKRIGSDKTGYWRLNGLEPAPSCAENGGTDNI